SRLPGRGAAGSPSFAGTACAGMLGGRPADRPGVSPAMTEQDWLTSTDPEAMLAFLRDGGRASERKLRLFAVACCRRIWDFLLDGRSREAVEVGEWYADGLADREQLVRATQAAEVAARILSHPPARAATWVAANDPAAETSMEAARAAGPPGT